MSTCLSAHSLQKEGEKKKEKNKHNVQCRGNLQMTTDDTSRINDKFVLWYDLI